MSFARGKHLIAAERDQEALDYQLLDLQSLPGELFSFLMPVRRSQQFLNICSKRAE